MGARQRVRKPVRRYGVVCASVQARPNGGARKTAMSLDALAWDYGMRFAYVKVGCSAERGTGRAAANCDKVYRLGQGSRMMIAAAAAGPAATRYGGALSFVFYRPRRQGLLQRPLLVNGCHPVPHLPSLTMTNESCWPPLPPRSLHAAPVDASQAAGNGASLAGSWSIDGGRRYGSFSHIHSNGHHTQ